MHACRYAHPGLQAIYLRLKSFQRFTESWALYERAAHHGLFDSYLLSKCLLSKSYLLSKCLLSKSYLLSKPIMGSSTPTCPPQAPPSHQLRHRQLRSLQLRSLQLEPRRL